MINKLRPKSKFSRNVLTLMTGTVVAQLITVAAAPLLTRVYSPEDFGIFATYVSIVVLLAIIATARYETAIMQPKKDKVALELMQIAFFLSFLFSIIILFVILVFHNFILKLTESSNLNGTMLMLIPLGVIATSLYNTVTQWLNRKKYYSRMGLNRIFQTSATAVVSLVLGYKGLLAIGLIFGYISGFIISMLLLLRNTKLKYNFCIESIIRTTRKYKNYPAIDLPASVLNAASSYLPIIFISVLMGGRYAGFYFLVERVLKAPMGIISNSIGSVFRQEAVNEKHQHGTYHRVFLKTFKNLFFIATPIFIFIFIVSPSAFELLFGQDWRQAGVFAQVLSPMFFFRFISSPLSFSFYISDKLHYDLVGQLFFSVGIFISLLVGHINNSISYVVLGISLTGSIVYVLYLIASFNLSKTL